MFVVAGKLVFMEVYDTASMNEKFTNLAEEIEAYTE